MNACLLSDHSDTRQNALRPKRGLLLRRLLIHRLKNRAPCVGLGGLMDLGPVALLLVFSGFVALATLP